MIHISERIDLQREYEAWINSKNKDSGGYIIRTDSIINFVFFLLERGILDEYNIHDYFKNKGD